MNLEGINPSEDKEGSKLNKRQEAMLVFLNHVTGSNHPIDNKGYEEVGRSQGIIEHLSPNEDFKRRLTAMFMSISRE